MSLQASGATQGSAFSQTDASALQLPGSCLLGAALRQQTGLQSNDTFSFTSSRHCLPQHIPPPTAISSDAIHARRTRSPAPPANTCAAAGSVVSASPFAQQRS